jgi:hypothetical protein
MVTIFNPSTYPFRGKTDQLRVCDQSIESRPKLAGSRFPQFLRFLARLVQPLKTSVPC